MGMRREDYAPLAVQDDLTGLHNRRSLLQVLKNRDGQQRAALVLFDFEEFRTLNEALTRARGGQFLRDFADRLRLATGPGDLVARYGGDSFALFLPGRSREEASALVEQFIDSLGEPPLLSPAEKLKANPAISAGVAAFPDDGVTTEAVLAAAARALFGGRRAGGKRVGVSGKLDESHVAERRSLDGLPCATYEGRTVELESADKLIDELRNRKSTLLLVEGEPGAGKSRFLREIARKAGRAAIQCLHLTGAASRKQISGGAFLAAVNRHYAAKPDAVQGLQKRFNAAQRALLAELVPSLAALRPEKPAATTSDQALLEETLKQMYAVLAGQGPFLLLVDEAHHVDRGTLDLIRSLVDDPQFSCGAALVITGEARSLRPERDRSLVQFIVDFTRTLKMRTVSLGPLQMAELLRMVDSILPAAKLPGGFAESLAKASQGNPLYLTEVVRSMVLRRRVQKTGAESWKVTPIERADLPPTVDEVLRMVFEALPPETRELTGRAAVLGAQFDLQTLQETLGQHEATVQDEIDLAAGAGVIRPIPEGGADDWEFASGHARDARYRMLTEDSKLRIHRRASAVLRLRAVDQPGMRAEMVFHAQVARGAYELAEVEESTEPARPSRSARLEEAKDPLTPEVMETAFAFLDALKACVRIRRIYPQWKQIAETYRDRAWKAWTALSKKAPRVTYSTAPRELRVNGTAHAVDSASELPELRLLLVDRLVGSLTLQNDLEERELDGLIGGLAAPMDKTIVPSDFWDHLMEKEGLIHLDIVQRRYIAKEGETAALRLSGLAPERLLRGEDLKLFWRSMRFLKGAAENLRLYPPGQELSDAAFLAAATAVEELLDETGRITVARADTGLLVNGLAAAADEAPDVATFLGDELRTKKLRSFSLMAGAPQDEIRVLVSVLAVADVVTAEGIIAATRTRHLAFKVQEEGITHERISDMHLPTVSRPSDDAAGLEDESEPIPIGPVRAQSPAYLVIRVDLRARACLVSPIDYFLSERSEKELPLMIETLRFGDLGDLADALVNRLAVCLGEKEATWRRRAILMTTRLLGDATGESRDKLISTFREPLQACLLEETDKDALRLLTETVRIWSKGALEARRLPLFAGFLQAAVKPKLDSPATSREFKIGLQSKLQTLSADGGGDPALEMLRTSPAPLRHMAIQILSVLGSPMIPALIEIVLTHPSSDTRRAAAIALKEIGGTAQQDLSRNVKEGAPTLPTVRALEVLELAGPGNIATPVYEALRHVDPKVPQEAIKLVKRVERPVAVATLRWVLMKDDFKVRSVALDLVREMKINDLAGDVARLMQDPADEALLKAACRTLAVVPTPSAIPHLRRIFDQKAKAFGIVKGMSDEVRALAVAAATAIDHDEARAITTQALKDKSQVVRDAAVPKTGRGRTTKF
ncbi:MAG TPA: diguanylate cyclase [Planctomycetota bacterium]|nr:diguanylate cyclase [Planctomycetota bacterium]